MLRGLITNKSNVIDILRKSFLPGVDPNSPPVDGAGAVDE
jgi:hypothetical protein